MVHATVLSRFSVKYCPLTAVVGMFSSTVSMALISEASSSPKHPESGAKTKSKERMKAIERSMASSPIARVQNGLPAHERLKDLGNRHASVLKLELLHDGHQRP